MRDRLKAVTPLVVSAIVVGIAAIAVVGAYANHASAEPTTSTEYAEYRNSRFGFSLPYPGDMTVGVYDQPDAGQKIQFSDPTADKIFEITTAPFTVLDVAIGEESAPTTNSDQSTQLGIVRVIRDDTFNVSFIKDGVAYTVTTMAQLETWLTNILKTWQFTD